MAEDQKIFSHIATENSRSIVEGDNWTDGASELDLIDTASFSSVVRLDIEVNSLNWLQSNLISDDFLFSCPLGQGPPTRLFA